MDEVVISHIRSTHPKYGQVWDLREEILRKPLGRSLKNDNMDRDLVDTIFIAEHNNQVIGCVIAHHLDNDKIQLRAMAVYNDWQGKGIGRLLVKAAEEFSAQNGYSHIVLHARKVVLGFYKSLGYEVSGDEFVEVGIPHFMMEKKVGYI